MSDDRQSPEAYLEVCRRSQRGRLKVYIGHAAGTGKTVQMLREANDLLAAGRKVIGAYIETHGRKGTEAAIGVLPVLPRKRIEYKGTSIEEMDVDEALRRRPDVAVVDELAHTNAPGSRRTKRYEDVDDLLDAGISVITAVNIQHIESLNPVVERITGVKVRETVPDSFIGSADEIVNLDLAVEDLRERLRRGEIYTEDKIERALGNFFTEANLSSLRELALREVAHHLDQARRERPVLHAVIRPGDDVLAAALSPVRESALDPVVMVAMSSRPPDVRNLLRKAAAISSRLNTYWYLVYVETPGEANDNIDATTQRILVNNLTLAKDLGATVVRLKATDISRALADFAREYGITHAIFGVSHPCSGLRRLAHLFRPPLVDRFAALAPGVDVHISGS